MPLINAYPRELLISPYEDTDISQARESLEAAARFYHLDPCLESQIFFTSPLTQPEKIRNQRDAVAIIFSARETLAQQARSPRRLQLLVANRDIFAPKMNFVFGLANREFGIALLSTYRLTRWVEELTPSQIQERILKEASHEIGHLIGLEHCDRQSCVMSYSESLTEVDSKLPLLCKNCSRKLGWS